MSLRDPSGVRSGQKPGGPTAARRPMPGRPGPPATGQICYYGKKMAPPGRLPRLPPRLSEPNRNVSLERCEPSRLNGGTTMGMSMLEAAKVSGTSKASIHRAIKAGRLSAQRREDGSYAIDPSELSRWSESRIETSRLVQHVPDTERPPEPAETAAMAALSVEVRLLRERLDEMRARAAAGGGARDEWRTQAQRLALTDERRPKAPWWAWFAGDRARSA